jgi:hypothetical protein
MNAKIFSYKVPGMALEPQNDHIMLSKSFDRKAILEPLKAILAQENYKIDETSLNYKIIDQQLYIQGIAVEGEEPKTVGFQFGK